MRRATHLCPAGGARHMDEGVAGGLERDIVSHRQHLRGGQCGAGRRPQLPAPHPQTFLLASVCPVPRRLQQQVT